MQTRAHRMTPVAGDAASLAGDPARRRRERADRRGSSRLRARVDRHHASFIVLTVLGRGDRVPAADRPRRSCSRAGWFPRRGMFDIATLLIGTLIVTVIAMLIAAPDRPAVGDLPLRVRAARGSASTVKPILEILAGIPSVVLGFFALTFINPHVVQTLVPERQGLQPRGGRHRRRHPDHPARSPRSPRTRCAPCRASLREASYGLGARRVTTTPPGRRPGRDLGHRRGDDPRHLARHRRDDGRGHRRRRHRRLAAHRRTRSSPGQTMTARDGRARHRLATRSPGDNAAFQSLFFVGPAAVPDHPRPQRRRRQLRPPHAAAVLRRAR